jgi:hypothetical protein
MTRHLGLLLLGACLAACPAKNPVGPADAGDDTCSARADCEGGLVCTDSRCAPCESSGQCLLKEECSADSRTCTYREGWGADCERNDQCQAGEWCRQGLCRDRTAVNLCTSGQATECPTGQRCNVTNLVCEEDLGCLEDVDCGETEACNNGLRQCVPRCTAETQTEVCSPGERCVASLCVQCAADSDCGPGLNCDGAGRCSASERCYSNAQCKVPLVCYLQTGECVPKLPPCVTDAACAADQRCDVGTGRCIPRQCQPDVLEPNDQPTAAFPAQPRAYTQLTLCNGDRDWFSLQLQRGDQLGINVDADPFAENTFTTVVQDAAGRTLSTGKLLASFVAGAPGKYYVGISSTDAFQPYDVTFLLSRGTPCTDDGFEPNDSAAAATAANAASQLPGNVCPQDEDWYRLDVPAGKGLQVTLGQYVASAGLLSLCVFDGQAQLGCSDDPALTRVVVSPAYAAGRTLHARVKAGDARIQNSYTLEVTYP